MWRYTYSQLMDVAMNRIVECGAHDMVDLGAETKSQNRINRLYMDRITFEMRTLKSEWADTGIEFLGKRLPSPIVSCPFAQAFRLLRTTVGGQAYLLELARATARAQSLFMCSAEPPQLQAIMDEGGLVIPIIKTYTTSAGPEDELMEFYLRDAERRGALAIGVDIDCFYGEKVGDEWPYGIPLGPKTVQQLRRYGQITSLPFVIKGVMSVHDAKVAVEEIGADVLMVGHHFGEIIDYAVPVLKILPDIRSAVPSIPIIVDTGFMRGSDVLKALALGADLVAVLEPLMLAYIAQGVDGTEEMFRILNDELRRNMSLTGCKDVASIESSILHFI